MMHSISVVFLVLIIVITWAITVDAASSNTNRLILSKNKSVNNSINSTAFSGTDLLEVPAI